MYHYTECGLRNVWLVNGYEWHDTPYGKGLSIRDADGLQRAIAEGLLRKPALTGAEFRFLRKLLDMSQQGVAHWMGNDVQAVARWEKTGKVPKWADRFLRAIYREHADGNANIRGIVERLNERDQENQARLILETTSQGWTAKEAA